MDLERMLQNVLALADTLRSKAKSEDRDLSEVEIALLESYAEQAVELKAKLEDARQRNNAISVLDGINEEMNRPVSIPAGGGEVTEDSPKIEVKNRWLDDPCKGFESQTEFFRDFVNFSLGNTSLVRKLDNIRHMNYLAAGFMSAAGADEMSGVSDPYGGVLLPVGFSPNLLAIAAEADPTQGRVSTIPMTAPSISIPARTDKNHTNSVSGGIRVYRRNETDTSPTSRMELEAVVLTANPLMGVTHVTEELLADSPISVAALLDMGFRDEYVSKVFSERLDGSGVGKHLGIKNSPANITIAKETGQAATTIVWKNVLKMRARCWRYSGAIWLANHDCLPELADMERPVGTGGVKVFQNVGEADVPDNLLGRPIIFTEFCETLGTQGDIRLVNWSQYLDSVYQAPRSDESIHVRFVNNERTFRFTARNAGAPWWRSALTVKKGANSLSPYVDLAVRA